jgi:hypothetical protein
MAIPADNFLAPETGDPLSFLIEEKDAPVKIMGNNPFLEVIQDPLQVFLARQQFFK